MKRSAGWFFGFAALGAAALVLAVVLLPRSFQPKERMPAGSKEPFISAVKSALASSEVDKRTGIPATRSRAALINPDVLMRQRGQELKLKVELFPDVTPLVSLKVLSGLDVNEGMHSGFIEDDPDSRVEFTTKNGMLSGFITYRRIKYRIVADPAAGLHYIVEEK